MVIWGEKNENSEKTLYCPNVYFLLNFGFARSKDCSRDLDTQDIPYEREQSFLFSWECSVTMRNAVERYFQEESHISLQKV